MLVTPAASNAVNSAIPREITSPDH
jgi:hypothetical protein